MGSVFSPTLSDISQSENCQPLQKMNAFLHSRDISPVRSPMETPWEEASQRTRRRYLHKTKQVVAAVLNEVAPNQSGQLWKSLVASKSITQQLSSDNETDEDELVDNVFMEALAECYHNANNWETRRQILSIMSDKVKFQTLRNWIPDLTRYRFTCARKHVLIHGRGVPPPQTSRTRMAVSKTQLDHFLDFICSPHLNQDLPFGESGSVKLSTKEVITVPNVIRMMIPESIVKQYVAYSEECGFTPLSRRTLLRILSNCPASTQKSLQGLDYISAEGSQAFDELCHVVERLGDCFKGMTWTKEQKSELKSAKRYLKSDFKVHVSKQSTVPDHCPAYALSDPKDKDFQSVCAHNHLDTCDRCASLTSVLDEIGSALQEMSNNNVATDIKEELTFLSAQAKKNIIAWKAHLLRCINQDDARLDVLDTLDENSVYLVQDWAMKFLPRKYRESQSDWFAKRGIPWHVTAAIRKTTGQGFQTMTFVHVFPTCIQDSVAVLAIMKDVIGQLKSLMPQLQSVFYRQDNAGCYHSGPTIVAASFDSQYHGVSVKRMDFSDPQGGKGPCDRKAASIKAHMRVHLNEGNNIETAKQMVDAIQSSNGVPGVSITLSDRVVSHGPSVSSIKLEGVSLISNVEYCNGYLRVWKAYGVGPGKSISLSQLAPTNDFKVPDLVKSSECTTNTEMPPVSFIIAKSKHNRVENTEESTSCSSASNEEKSDDNPTTSLLFSCPEEGCIKTYQRFSSLQLHLDSGKHQRSLENETLYDKAVHGYAARLEEQFGGVPQMQQFTNTQRINQDRPSLPMGWALKSSQTKRFSEKQKSYLSNQFLIGETTGQKENPASVAKAMMTVRDSNGNRIFTSDEFLTSKQITSFFSRMSSKRTLPDQITEFDMEEEHNVEKENDFNELGNRIMDDVALTHPIYFESYNLCELIANSTLSKFAIQMLQNICEYFDISTEGIQSRRKAPYIERIVDFGKKCTCSSTRGCTS
ncbi:hypothetical protein QZH41_018426 [Actinostola sp. cb2023]|nr:hypothetical protein QZH41_018426 [Actinostola sp. cb2023]